MLETDPPTPTRPRRWQPQATIRRLAKSGTERLPASWLLRVRDSYLKQPDTSAFGRWCRGRLLEVIRLRGIPKDEPFRVAGHPDLMMAPTDSYITNYLYWMGLDAYEVGEPAWWASLVATHTSTLEIGGNIGLYTLVGAKAAPDHRYQVIEPNPQSYDVLRRNLELNGLDRVEAVRAAAVGDRSADEVVLQFPDRDPYGASAGAFVQGALDLDTRATRTIVVPTVTAADLIEGVDLLKLDIEGLEVEVLGAIRAWITSTLPSIVVEVRDDAVRLQNFLADLVDETGFECWVISDGQPQQIPRETVAEGGIEECFGTRDVTLLTPERAVRALLAHECREQ